MRRVLIALALVPSAYPALILLSGGDFADIYAAVVGVVTGGVSLFLGVPLALWFIKRRWFKFWQSLLAGALVGFSVGLYLNTYVEFGESFIFALKYSALGCLHTAAFWLVAFWKNQAFLLSSAREVQST